MSVKINVIKVDRTTKTVTIVAYDERNGNKITKSPVKVETMTTKGIESAIKKAFKIFNAPVWGGMSIYYELEDTNG